MVRLFSCLVPKSAVQVEVDGQTFVSLARSGERSVEPCDVVQRLPIPDRLPQAGERTKGVPLIALAYGRSGDKGDAGNIGVLARKPEYVAILREQLTADAVRSEEHTSELQSLMRNSYAVFCLKKKITPHYST